MNNKNYENSYDSSDSKEYQNGKNILSKLDHDLFDEDKDVVEKVVRVKRVQVPNKGESWRLFENNKIAFTLDGSKLSKKEREYLRTPDGFNFLILQFKDGIKTFSKLKADLKKKVK